ncbi:hypothetical protein FRC07_012428 [Ceratobasidium sp. 392]|nr:hypothetical protein FRC07_012428 [Ceratobasidium sp. 392]
MPIWIKREFVTPPRDWYIRGCETRVEGERTLVNEMSSPSVPMSAEPVPKKEEFVETKLEEVNLGSEKAEPEPTEAEPRPGVNADSSRASTPGQLPENRPRFSSAPIWQKNIADRTRAKWKAWKAEGQRMRLYVEVPYGPKRFRKQLRKEAEARGKARRAAARQARAQQRNRG